MDEVKLTKAQRETLDFIAANRGARGGVYTMDAHEEATTFRSLHRRGLIGLYVLPRRFIANAYVITPAGRAALTPKEQK